MINSLYRFILAKVIAYFITTLLFVCGSLFMIMNPQLVPDWIIVTLGILYGINGIVYFFKLLKELKIFDVVRNIDSIVLNDDRKLTDLLNDVYKKQFEEKNKENENT